MRLPFVEPQGGLAMPTWSDNPVKLTGLGAFAILVSTIFAFLPLFLAGLALLGYGGWRWASQYLARKRYLESLDPKSREIVQARLAEEEGG